MQKRENMNEYLQNIIENEPKIPPFYFIRKISEMDIDEFMAHGFDSDVSTGDEEDIMGEKQPDSELNERLVKHMISLQDIFNC